MQHAVLYEKTNFKNILEKAFFFILSGFFPNWEFVSKKFEKKAHLRCEFFFLNWSYWVQNRELSADLKSPYLLL